MEAIAAETKRHEVRLRVLWADLALPHSWEARSEFLNNVFYHEFIKRVRRYWVAYSRAARRCGRRPQMFGKARASPRATAEANQRRNTRLLELFTAAAERDHQRREGEQHQEDDEEEEEEEDEEESEEKEEEEIEEEEEEKVEKKKDGRKMKRRDEGGRDQQLPPSQYSSTGASGPRRSARRHASSRSLPPIPISSSLSSSSSSSSSSSLSLSSSSSRSSSARVARGARAAGSALAALAGRVPLPYTWLPGVWDYVSDAEDDDDDEGDEGEAVAVDVRAATVVARRWRLMCAAVDYHRCFRVGPVQRNAPDPII